MKILAAAATAATVLMVTLGTAPTADAAAKCRTGDQIYTQGNRIYCISRTKKPKCARAQYRTDYSGMRDQCVRFRANGSVRKVFEPKCGFLGAGPGRLMVRGMDRCAYNPNIFRR